MVGVPVELARPDAEVVAAAATLLLTTTAAALEELEPALELAFVLRVVAAAEVLAFGELEMTLPEADE